MPGFEPLYESKREEASPRNLRLGLILFSLYLAVYATYVLLSAFWPETLDVVVLGGVNLAVAYGFGLIALAFVLALLYAWLCEKPKDDRETPILP